MSRFPKALLAGLAAALALAGCSVGESASPDPAESEAGEAVAAASTPAAIALEGEPLTRPFSADSPWNSRIDGLPADPRSQRLISLAKRRRDVVYVPGRGPRVVTRTIDAGPFINTRRWSDSIVEATEGVPTTLLCRQRADYCGDGESVETLTIPPEVQPQPQYDGWFTVIDRAAGAAYDLWRARRSADGSVISYLFMRRWALDGPGFLPPGTASARGSGLPLFAGVITPGEIEAGRIEHALAISLPGPAASKYVQPASATDGVGPESSLPEGARIRLRPSAQLARISTGTNARAARAIMRALRLYGAIVVDRARVPTLYAQINFDWGQPLRNAAGRLVYGDGRELPARLQAVAKGVPLLRGHEVQSLRLDDFEVVQLPPKLSYPPSEDGATTASAEP